MSTKADVVVCMVARVDLVDFGILIAYVSSTIVTKATVFGCWCGICRGEVGQQCGWVTWVGCTGAQPIRLAKWAKIPGMSQLAVRVTTKGSGLVFLDPKPSLPRRHGVRLTNGVADVSPDRPFEVIVANFSRKDGHLPKGCMGRRFGKQYFG